MFMAILIILGVMFYIKLFGLDKPRRRQIDGEWDSDWDGSDGGDGDGGD